MAGWRSMSLSVEMRDVIGERGLEGGCTGPGVPGGALRCRGRCFARLHCGARSCGASRNSLRALWALRSDRRDESDDEARCARSRKPCAPRRGTGAPHPEPLGLCSNGASVVRHASTRISLGARCNLNGLTLRRREAQIDGRRAPRASSSDSLRLSERSACRARSELRDATVDRASQRSRAKHRPPQRESVQVTTCHEAGHWLCCQIGIACGGRALTISRQMDTP